ncbi:thioredoxin domain-containing protein [Candidatus Gracilibacteria bacterium]|nr:thioredoxin domain-containing protein [Candidatus Gracilibacteria bacterium]
MLQKKIMAVATLVAVVGSMGSVSAAKSQLESAKQLAGQGVIKTGSTSADFGLGNTITRKEIMKIVLNLSGKNVTDTCSGEFGDVANDWGCKYIEAGLRNGFIAKNASFRPNDSISKAEAMKLILKARGIDKAYNTSDWQADYMNTAYDNSIIASKYSDHGTKALRGWIFGIGAADKATRSNSAPVVDNTSVDDDIDDIFEGILGDDVLEAEPEASAPVPVVTSGKTGFLDYDSSLLGQNEDTVLFFHASWCPSCRSAEKNINSTGVDDYLLLKVDYDSNKDLRTKYRVRSQHTFVQVDADGEYVTSWTGSSSAESIKAKIR